MTRLLIQEEYGYRHWMVDLNDEEYRDLIRRWETMSGLGCLVPVIVIIPQATPLDATSLAGMTFDAHCHIHGCEDSYLDGSSYTIPPSDDGRFWMDGQPYDFGADWHSDCADIIISREVSTAEAESLLAQVVPGGDLAVIADGQDPPMDCSTVASLTRRNDPAWPTLLRFPLLTLDSPLGNHPHLTLAEHLSERLSAKVLTVSSGLLAESQLDLNTPDGWVVRMDGGWYLAGIVRTSDGSERVGIGDKLPHGRCGNGGPE